jgi:hypothetical protein
LSSKFAANGPRICEAGEFDRNAFTNSNVTQNRNLSKVLRNPGFAKALLWDGLLEHYFSNVNSVSLSINYMNKVKSVSAQIT